jgi:hypothetical protein
MSKRENETCAVCRIVRTYLLVAVPLLAMVGFSTLSDEDSLAPPWFASVELIGFLATLSVASLLIIVSYKAYDEYWAPRKKKEKLESLVTKLREDGEG